MKLAGPPAMIEVLELTNSPAPMMPPIDIIVRWRPLSERLSSFLPGVAVVELVWTIRCTFFQPLFIVDTPRRQSTAPSIRRAPHLRLDAHPRVAQFRNG